MIDLKDIRERPEQYQKACDDKGIKFDVAAFLERDAQVRLLKQEVEAMRAQQNAVSKELPALSGDEKQSKLAEMKGLSQDLKDKTSALRELEGTYKRELLLVPGIPLEGVPVGKDDTENVEVRKWGDLPEFSFAPKDHVELGKALDLIDIERGVKIAGTRNYFLKGQGALLQRALLSYAIDFLADRGFIIMDPPHIVKWDAMMGTSYFPGGEEQAYHLDERDDGFYLIGTGEVPVCAYHSDEILSPERLPLRYAGFSACYRREAGTYGRDTHGLYRIHQFYKVEQVVFCLADPEESARMHQELLKNAEDYVQSLELPYRVVDVCTGDMGQGQVFKNDIECWMPSRNSYSETHSCSTFHDFQARRLGVRYKDATGNNIFCHTLNNTCVASPRILIPLLENNQKEDGSVVIPEVLRPYLRGAEAITA